MNQKQINRLEMFQATNDHLDTNPEVWSAIPIVGTYKNQLFAFVVFKDLLSPMVV